MQRVGEKLKSCSRNSGEQPARGGSMRTVVSVAGKSIFLKMDSALAAVNSALSIPFNLAFWRAQLAEVSETSTPATCLKCLARLSAKSPDPQ